MTIGTQICQIYRHGIEGKVNDLNNKTQKSWKYSDKTCVGCGENSETGDTILSSTGLITKTIIKFSLVPMGVLAPGSAHA